LGLIVSCGFWLICVKVLLISGLALAVLQIALQVTFFASLIWMAYRFADLAGDYLTLLASRTESTLDDQIVKLVARTLKLFAVLTGIILAAQNLGFNVVSLLAGLSIGGLAVALAMQSTLTNFIGSIIIMIDRAFKVGDWIKIGDTEGDVEEVDFRSTRLRTFYDSVVTIPNSEVMNSKIDNMGRRKHRRVLTSLRITPDTPPEKIESLIEGIKQIIANAPATRKDLYHVVLKDFGPDSLEIMLYFFLKVPDLSRELMERQRVLLEVLRLARKLEIRFATPIQSLQIEQSRELEAQLD
jgi:MscS family membrane protein